MTKKILVPVHPGDTGLKSVHYALSLAERLKAQVFIMQMSSGSGDASPQTGWLGEVLTDLITNARLAGLNMSHLTVTGPPEDEIAAVVREEGIDLLVLGADQLQLEAALLHHQPQLEGSIIRVKEKDTMSILPKKGGRRWPS